MQPTDHDSPDFEFDGILDDAFPEEAAAEPGVAPREGNRPAAEARQASLSEALSGEWSGAGEDFLHLDQELGGPAAAAGAFEPEAPAVPAESGPAEGGPEFAPLDEPSPVDTRAEDLGLDDLDLEGEEDDGSWLMSLDDVLSDRAGEDPILGATPDDPFAAGPATLDASWHEDEPAPKKARRVLAPLAGLVVVAFLGAAGWRFVEVWRTREREPLQPLPAAGPSDVVAPATPEAGGRRTVVGRGGATRPAEPGSGVPAAGPATGPVARGSETASPPSPGPAAPHSGSSAGESRGDSTAGVAGAAGAEASGARPSTGVASGPPSSEPIPPAGPEADSTSGSALARAGSETPEPSRSASRHWRRMLGLTGSREKPAQEPDPIFGDGTIAVSPTAEPPRAEGPGALPYGLEQSLVKDWKPAVEGSNLDPKDPRTKVVRSAEFGDMTGIWRGEEVPLAAVDSQGKLQTPGVGFVAVRLDGGQVVDGVMTSVGDGHVWVQTPTGRVGLKGERVREVDRVGEQGAHELIVESLERVRVQTERGVILGRVLSHDDENATILTEGGSRITVPAGAVEVIGTDADVLLKHS